MCARRCLCQCVIDGEVTLLCCVCARRACDVFLCAGVPDHDTARVSVSVRWCACAQDLNLALQHGGEDSAVYYHRGNALLEAGKPDDAIGTVSVFGLVSLVFVPCPFIAVCVLCLCASFSLPLRSCSVCVGCFRCSGCDSG